MNVSVTIKVESWKQEAEFRGYAEDAGIDEIAALLVNTIRGVQLPMVSLLLAKAMKKALIKECADGVINEAGAKIIALATEVENLWSKHEQKESA